MPARRRIDPEHQAPALLAEVRARLHAAGVPSPAADARFLLAHVLRDTEAAQDPSLLATRLEPLVTRREAREPLQLVLGSTAFRTVEVACRPGVFIPRPETEVVAGVAIDRARHRLAATGQGAVVIAEPCTGTGAIAVAVAAEVPAAQIIATDLDPAAVALARVNVAGRRVAVLKGDLLAPLDPALRGHLDVLVANPPYLPACDRGSFDVEVAAHDPDRALIGGPDGHEVVDRLLMLAADWLAPGGSVVLEIDERRADAAAEAATRAGLVEAVVVPDLTGAPRLIAARRGELSDAPG